MRLIALDTSATNWPIVPAPDFGEMRINLGLNLGCLGGKPATNRPSYGTALIMAERYK
jgi:hypothetical protein